MADSEHNLEVQQRCRKCKHMYPLSSYPYKFRSVERAKACRTCGIKDREQASQRRARNQENELLDIPKTSIIFVIKTAIERWIDPS